jgi:hypothetical protein
LDPQNCKSFPQKTGFRYFQVSLRGRFALQGIMTKSMRIVFFDDEIIWSNIKIIWSNITIIWNNKKGIWSNIKIIWSNIKIIWSNIKTIWSSIKIIWSFLNLKPFLIFTLKCVEILSRVLICGILVVCKYTE